jgi:hypothetical protein
MVTVVDGPVWITGSFPRRRVRASEPAVSYTESSPWLIMRPTVSYLARSLDFM